MRITCPPITHACHFGVDMGHDGDLMAARLDGRRDPRADRRRQPRVPVARGDDAGDRHDDGDGRLLQRLLHRALPDRGRATPRPSSRFEGVAGVSDPRRSSIGGGGPRAGASPGRAGRHGHDGRASPPTLGDAVGRPTVDLVILGPEAALAAGVADECAPRGIAVLRADRRAGPARVVEGLRPRAGRRRSASPARRIAASTPATPTARWRGGASSAGRSSSSSTGWPPARA